MLVSCGVYLLFCYGAQAFFGDISILSVLLLRAKVT